MPPTSGRNKRTPKVVLDRRIHSVASMLAAGATRAQVLQTVANLQIQEAKDRAHALKHNARAKEVNALYDALPADEQQARVRMLELPDVELLWGDDEIPERTVDRYIHEAKEEIADELEEMIADRARMVGFTWARLQQLYAAAFAARKYHACHQTLRTQILLFGLEKTAAMLMPPEEDETTIGGDGKPRLPMVEVVSDGPRLPSERRRQLLEQMQEGAKDALANPVAIPPKK